MRVGNRHCQNLHRAPGDLKWNFGKANREVDYGDGDEYPRQSLRECHPETKRECVHRILHPRLLGGDYLSCEIGRSGVEVWEVWDVDVHTDSRRNPTHNPGEGRLPRAEVKWVVATRAHA